MNDQKPWEPDEEFERLVERAEAGEPDDWDKSNLAFSVGCFIMTLGGIVMCLPLALLLGPFAVAIPFILLGMGVSMASDGTVQGRETGVAVLLGLSVTIIGAAYWLWKVS
ncbi:hypothetical protein EON80_23565 [bacterium]|nr:MAG: hypothetical protein EON80_23565 [bacterium]